MDEDRDKLILALAHEANRLSVAERIAFLDEACAGDADLRAEIEARLRTCEPTDPAKDHPPDAERQAFPAGSDAAGKKTLDALDATGLHHVAIKGYKIIRQLQHGGQGIVYQAIQLSTKRKVALKVLLEGRFASEKAKRRFDREIELVASLHHPNIVALFDSGVTDGTYWYAMDYVRGSQLDQYVRSNHLPLEDALALFAKICEAVSHAHQRGVIHRDLKPSNIFVDHDGAPMVLDFGLAKLLTSPEETLLSLTGQMVGTLPYMSPEQARGSPDEIDIRTDVYSLGVILYEILTGQYPYPVVGQIADVLKHINETPPTPMDRAWKPDSGVMTRSKRKPKSSLCPIDEEVRTIVLRALNKEPERRYDNAGQLARDIRHYMAGEPIEAKRDSLAYLMRTQLRRHRLSLAVACGFVLMLIIGLSTSLVFWQQAVAAEREQRTERERADRAVALLTLLVDAVEAPIPQSAGSQSSVPNMTERAQADIEQYFGDQPHRKASVHSALASLYINRRLWREAAVQAVNAANIIADLYGAEHEKTRAKMRQASDCLSNLSVEQRTIGEYELAAASAREAIRLGRQGYDSVDRRVQWTRGNLAAALSKLGEFEEARRILDEIQEEGWSGHPNFIRDLRKEISLGLKDQDIRTIASPTVSSQPTIPAAKNPVIKTETSAMLLDYLSRMEAHGFSGAVLVAKDDTILCRRACGLADRAAGRPNTTATQFDIGSVTKQFTAAAVVKLQSDGLLSVDAPISTLLHGVPADKHGITVHHLLTHTSGLPRGIRLEEGATMDRRQAIAAICAIPLRCEPGSRWLYSNTGYQLLACIIEEVTGERFEEHLRRRLFSPAGMTNTRFLSDSEMTGTEQAIGYASVTSRGTSNKPVKPWYHWGLRGCGGVLTSIEDLWRWEQALRGEVVLSAEEKELMFAKHHRSHSRDSYYGYGWDISDRFSDIRNCVDIRSSYVGHGGDTRGFETKFYRFPDLGLTIIVLSNTNAHHAWWMPIHMLSILFGEDCAIPPSVVPLSEEELSAWEGLYVSEGGLEVMLRNEGSWISLLPVNQASLEWLRPKTGRSRRNGIPAVEANQRAETAMGGWVEKDLARLDGVLDPQWPDWSRRLSRWLDEEALARGGYESHRVLGTVENRGRIETFVEIVFAHGPAQMKLYWNRDRITRCELPAASPVSLRFVPESPTRLNHYNIDSFDVITLEREPHGNRSTLRLVLQNAPVQVFTSRHEIHQCGKSSK